MDKELLQSFNNLSIALQNLTDTLQRNSERSEASSSSIADALKNLNVGEQFKAINDSLKKVNEVNAKVVETQKEISSSVNSIGADFKTFKQEQLDIQAKTSEMVQKISEKQDQDSKKIESVNEAVKKQKEDKGPNYLPDKEQKKTITDGIKIVVMIAAGVLAIGLAFKLIGQVNFLSVLALAAALPLVAIAVEKISQLEIDLSVLEVNLFALMAFSVVAVATSYILSAVRVISLGQAMTVILIATSFAIVSYSLDKLTQNLKDIDLGSLAMMPLVLLTASIAITLSSFVLRKVNTISFEQAITIVMISAAFALLSYNIAEMTQNIKEVSVLGLILMPLVLVAASLAIVGASYVLAAVRPVGLIQLLTSIAIAAVFAVVSFGLVEIAKAVGKIDPLEAILIPIVLVAVSIAIAASSFFFAQVQLISFRQFLTSVGIAIVFIPISIALPFIAKAVSRVDILTATAMPLVLIPLAFAIMASSHILVGTKPIDSGLLFNIVLQSISLAVIGITMAATVWVLDKLGIASPAGLKKTVMAGLSILAIATTVSLTSHILAAGNYSGAPTIGWVLMSAATILVYGLLIGAIGLITKFFGGSNMAQVILGGSLVILAIATTIMATSHILAAGDYTVYPSISWLLMTSASILVYGILIGVVGAIIALTGGTGAIAVLAGSLAILAIAATITAISHILAAGDYTKFPTLSWTLQSAASILAYGILISVVGAIILLTGGIGAGILILGAVAIIGIAATILAVDKIFAEGKYDKYPSFTYIFNSIFVLGGFGLLMAATGIMLPLIALGYLSIKVIANSILDVDQKLSEGNFNKFPSLEYVLSTVLLLGGYAAIMIAAGAMIIPIMLGKISIGKVAEAIVDVDKKLAEGSYNKYPDKDYALAVGKIMAAYSAVMIASGAAIPLIYLGKKSMSMIAESIRDSSLILAEGNYIGGPTPQWADGVGKAIGAFSQVYETLTSKGVLGFLFGGEGSSPEKMKQAIVTISEGITTAATYFSENATKFENYPPSAWSEGVGKAIGAFAPVYATLTDKGLIGKIMGGGGSSPEKMASAIKTITQGIITSANIFSESATSFNNPPPEAWSKGAGEAIKAFAPVFEYLNGGSWLSNAAMRTAELFLGVVGISNAIVASAKTFSESGVTYTNYPTEEWSKGVSQALVAFSPIMKWVSENSGIFGADAEDLKDTVVAMAESITKTSHVLSEGKFDLTIPETFGPSILSLYESYMKINELISPMSGFFQGLGNKISGFLGVSGATPESVAQNIVEISRVISQGSFSTTIPEGYMSSVYENIKEFLKISELLKGIDDEKTLFNFNLTAASGITKMADDYDKLAGSVQRLSNAISSIEIEKIAALKSLTANVVLLSLMDPEQFDEMMEKFEEKSEVLGDVFSQLAENGDTVQPMVRQPAAAEPTSDADLKSIVNIMSQMNQKLSQLVSYSGNLSSYVNELRTTGERVTMKR